MNSIFVFREYSSVGEVQSRQILLIYVRCQLSDVAMTDILWLQHYDNPHAHTAAKLTDSRTLGVNKGLFQAHAHRRTHNTKKGKK